MFDTSIVPILRGSVNNFSELYALLKKDYLYNIPYPGVTFIWGKSIVMKDLIPASYGFRSPSNLEEDKNRFFVIDSTEPCNFIFISMDEFSTSKYFFVQTFDSLRLNFKNKKVYDLLSNGSPTFYSPSQEDCIDMLKLVDKEVFDSNEYLTLLKILA